VSGVIIDSLTKEGRVLEDLDPLTLGDINIKTLKMQRYTKQISPKTLAAPSSKDFLYILEFLYHQFDPQFLIGDPQFDPQFKIGKPEDDVVFIFKTLKYVLSLAIHKRVLNAL
jgi:SMC interacting uncharacterized protein involved in chromosome segregation